MLSSFQSSLVIVVQPGMVHLTTKSKCYLTQSPRQYISDTTASPKPPNHTEGTEQPSQASLRESTQQKDQSITTYEAETKKEEKTPDEGVEPSTLGFNLEQRIVVKVPRSSH
jgi:hypothetical protein